MANVTIYSTQTCGYCKMAKDFFKENNISYTEYDAGVDRDKAREMIEKSGQMGVPVIVVEDGGKEQLIVGFDQPRLEAALKLS